MRGEAVDWKHSGWHLAAHVLLGVGIMLGLGLMAGCQAPAAVVESEARATRAEAAAFVGADALVQSVATALRRARKQHALDLFDLAWGEKVGPDGKIASEDARSLRATLDEKFSAADADYSVTMAALATVRLNITDAKAIRGSLREYMTGAGVTPEAVNAVVLELERRLATGNGVLVPAPEGGGPSAGAGGGR